MQYNAGKICRWICRWIPIYGNMVMRETAWLVRISDDQGVIYWICACQSLLRTVAYEGLKMAAVQRLIGQ